MKADYKLIIIAILSGALVFLCGYILGNSNQSTSSISPADPGASKEYKDLVAKEIKNFSQEISSCYRIFLETNPRTQEGKVNLVFLVSDNGKVSEVEISRDELSSESLSSCIVNKLSPLRLPPLPRGINPYVSHSLVFKKEETLKREIEERKKSIPQVLPVN